MCQALLDPSYDTGFANNNSKWVPVWARAAGFAVSAAPARQDPSVLAHGEEGPGSRLVGNYC